MAEAFVDRLTPILAAGDLVAARELLESLDADERSEARDWFARSRRWLGSLYGELAFVGDDGDAEFETMHRAEWIVAMCAVRLCGPTTAAKRVPWGSLWDFMDNPGEAEFVQMLWDTDGAWVAAFVEAASGIGLGGNARNLNHQLSRALRAAAVHHRLPCPTGATFLACWWAGTEPHENLAARLAADPFMPDLLFRYLSSGHCGELTELPTAVAELCESGAVDRGEVLDHVLQLLTGSQRPGSQKVLAGILKALALEPSEVPGGLTYLLGVLATSHRSVVPTLLPHAIGLIGDSGDLRQVTAVLAGRPEKQPKATLLAALRTPALVTVAGHEAVLEALAVLGGGDDASFSDKVARAVAALDPARRATPPPIEPVASALGLWDLSPIVAADDLARSVRGYGEATWEKVLDTNFAHRARIQPRLITLTVNAMAAGTFGDGQPMREASLDLLARHRLSMSALAGALDDLFLAGGLRQGWTVALDIAESACGAPRRPAGFATLLRTLTRYAVEVPRPQTLPAHLAALAQGRTRTKEQMEALRLAATLSDSSAETALDRLRAADDVPMPPVCRGLWTASVHPLTVLPPQVRLADPTDPVVDLAEDLDLLREVLSQDYNGYSQSYADYCHWGSGYGPRAGGSPTSVTYPDRALAATVAGIGRHGAPAVRAALRGIERSHAPLDVVAAIDLWIAEGLDIAAFWRVAHGSVPLDLLQQRWEEGGVARKEVGDRTRALPGLAASLQLPDHPDAGALVLPRELSTALTRFEFLRAAEALIRAEDVPILLATPTYADGTLDLDDLLERMAAHPHEAPVGPIDLVQALHRLRPVDPDRADEVPGSLRTDPAFTHRQGGQTWDASELVRVWVTQGGLPELEPQPDAQGRWTTTTVSPVPFTRLAALPVELAQDPWAPGPDLATVRMMPRWGDRVVDRAFQEWPCFDPRHFPGLISGPFGVPVHDRLLSLLTPQYNSGHLQGVPALVHFAQHGRLVPAAAAAAAVGRHQAGTLRLGLLTKSLQRGFEDGGFRGLWPTALAIAGALGEAARRPSNLPELLRLLTSYAHEVPAGEDSELPQGLRRLAESRGHTQSHLAARELLAVLTRAGAG